MESTLSRKNDRMIIIVTLGFDFLAIKR